MILKKPKNFPLRVYNLNQRKKISALGLGSAPRDYSLKGTKADRTFNAIRARIATIAFAYNIGNFLEMQVLHCLNCEIVLLCRRTQ
jgi:hypothetical protein